MDAKLALPVLDQLQQLGFGDNEFAQVHHFRAEGRRFTIQAFRNYCLKTGSFNDGDNNERTYWRLKRIIEAYQAAGRSPQDGDFFNILADNWFKNLPPLPGR